VSSFINLLAMMSDLWARMIIILCSLDIRKEIRTQAHDHSSDLAAQFDSIICQHLPANNYTEVVISRQSSYIIL